FARAHYSLLLTDDQGLILHSGAGGEFGPIAQQLKLIEGGRWSEEIQGTNAIGTALAEQLPVTVEAQAHYVRSNHNLICYACPIFDPYGRLVGALDATSRVRAAHPAVQAAILSGAQAVEAQLRRQAWLRAGLSELSAHLARCRRPAVVVEWPGLVRAANDEASRPPLNAQTGTPLERLFGLTWADLLVALTRGRRTIKASTWGLRDGAPRELTLQPIEGDDSMALAVLLTEPERRTTHAGMPPQRRSEPTMPEGAARHFQALLGSDPAQERTKRLAARIAHSDLPALILAETGTGKGLLARAIHNSSTRASGPLVDINCGALSEHLLESELFGYAPGAFTGAQRQGSEGKIHQARGGTLFLDEIAETSPRFQATLLRVLEDGTYFRVGEHQPRCSDFRLICATCRDLEAMVDDGRFRRDLYYRIRGAVLSLPALSKRSDILELSHGLLDVLTPEGEPAPRLSPDAAQAILHHSWPGNIRELRMALQFALVMAEGRLQIQCSDLPPDVQEALHIAPPSAAETLSGLTDTKRHLLTQALTDTDGNISEVARRLGVARSTVYRMMKRHGLR
ncbi:MAG: sigma-54-dependent Fis family transcriptional regulator, partial [Myxococcota bacterium]